MKLYTYTCPDAVHVHDILTSRRVATITTVNSIQRIKVHDTKDIEAIKEWQSKQTRYNKALITY